MLMDWIWIAYAAWCALWITIAVACVRFDVLDKKDAALMCVALCSGGLLWVAWQIMGRTPAGAQHPLADDTSSADKTADNPDTVTTPEPSHEAETSPVPRDVRDADDLDDYIDAVEGTYPRDE